MDARPNDRDESSEFLQQPLMDTSSSPVEESTSVFEDAFQVVEPSHATEQDPTDSAGGAVRQGTIASARFNILSTMVGGGSLSLPLAFAKTGNALMGPLILILIAGITEFCFFALLDAARTLSPVHHHHHHHRNRPGKDSLESISAAALGATAYYASTLLVTLMCFFGIVGYCVLIRDMLEPVTDWLSPSVHRTTTADGPTAADNVTLLATVVAVTPLCTLRTLTALQKFGATSMCSIFILGVCILYRSLQCTIGYTDHHHHSNGSSHWTDGFRFFPDSWKDVLDVLPLFISCYVCHFNLPVVHNDLYDPTPSRVQWWLRSTVWGSTVFYLTVGISGSAYAMACSDGNIHGNILLDFPEDDPLLLTGRLCLALTIALAFPMVTIPARDILIRTFATTCQSKRTETYHAAAAAAAMNTTAAASNGDDSSLLEPLLRNNEVNCGDDETPPSTVLLATTSADERLLVPDETAGNDDNDDELPTPPSLGVRLLASVTVLWTGAAVASCVSSIDMVWDLLGSSLSIMLSYLIPSACYLVISKKKPQEAEGGDTYLRDSLYVAVCWLLILVFTPLMFISTANAVYNTFFRK